MNEKNTRRNFLRTMTALPVIAPAIVDAVAAEPKPHLLITCCHCFELVYTDDGHNCEEYAAWKAENP
jgi:hypothetical protein